MDARSRSSASVWAQAEDNSEAAATAMRILFLHGHAEQVGTAIGNLPVVVVAPVRKGLHFLFIVFLSAIKWKRQTSFDARRGALLPLISISVSTVRGVENFQSMKQLSEQ